MKFPYRRILVVGCGGAGKSTLARTMGERFSLPVVHLDKLWWLPGWVQRTQEEFDALLAGELQKPEWIIDGNFVRTLSMRLKFADCCVFLDLDTDICLKSAYARVEEFRGRTRPDMTEGCWECVDPEFEKWILNFHENTRPEMLALLEQSGKPCFVFTERNQAYEWLEVFEG